jgi:hypothetical protein
MRLRGPDELPGADDLLARLRPLAPAAERAA